MPQELTPEDADAAVEYFTNAAQSAREASLWKPGQSGNPMGRPKEPTEDLDAMLTLVATKSGRAKKLAQHLVDIALDGKSHVNLAAVQYIFDRLEGKPRQSVPDREEKKDPLVVVLERLISSDRALEGRSAPPPALPARSDPQA